MKKTNRSGIPSGGLAMVLMRWTRGWWEQATLAARAGFHSSQVSMWERGERVVPLTALEKTADVTGFPRYLLEPLLRLLRSFRAARKRTSRPSRTLAQVSVAELFPLLDEAIDLILAPLAAEACHPETAPEPEALLERLKRRTERQRRLMVERIPEFQTRALAEHLTRESRRLAADQPEESREWATLAALAEERARRQPRPWVVS